MEECKLSVAQRRGAGKRLRGNFVLSDDASRARRIEVHGRNLWALERLRVAAERGVSALQEPAPRWASYVHRLRRLGLVIDTILEPHDGPYPGHHARYVLRSVVESEGIAE